MAINNKNHNIIYQSMDLQLQSRLAAAHAHPSHPSFVIGEFEPFGP